MALVRSTDTKPEWRVRRLVHGMGYRYRLHRRDLPGVPDLVFISRHKVIFVHGCFWHGHLCQLGRLPKSKTEYWIQKIEGNRRRDARNFRRLRKLSWKCLVLWECQLRNLESIETRVRRFLDEQDSSQPKAKQQK
jgi:DNA mismatch endonuclease, patch repair protein